MKLLFNRIPWQSNERTEYRIRVRNEEGEMEKLGEMEFRLSGIREENNKKTINIHSITQLLNINFKEESILLIDAISFKPLFFNAFLATPQGNIRIKGEYTEKHIKIFSSSSQGRKNNKIPISRETYDNSEIIHVFRAFNFKKFKKQHFKIFNILTAQEVPASAKLVGEEKVKVPAGEFECYRIKLELYDFTQEMRQYFLYSKCPSKLFVKNISGTQVIELINKS